MAYQTVPEAFIYPVSLKILLGTVALAVAVPSIIADTFPVSGPIVSGGVARLHRGQAAAPKKARRSRLSEQFGLQINSGRSHTGTAAVTSRLRIVGTIVLALFPTCSVPRV